MPYSLLEAADESADGEDRRIFGVAVAQVIQNEDDDRQGWVQIRLPWMPGVEPWARVVAPVAGPERGIFTMPQVDDEVLVAFHHGDVREPYVLGCLWNAKDRAPAKEAKDAVNKWIMRTPKGHEIVFDDKAKTITITSFTDHKITLGSDKVEIVDDKDANQRITLDKNGITLEAKKGDLVLKAPQGSIQIEGRNVAIKSSAQTKVEATSDCVISGLVVRIN
jgi:uncharacterized protein involved in type VI secretion and phage assembly